MEQQNSAGEDRANMIMDMEKKLNSSWFNRRATALDQMCTLTTSHYWDWLVHIDDDYLTEFEVLKMKQLHYSQLQQLSGQFVVYTSIAWFASHFVMGPLVRSAIHSWHLRLPITLSIATYLGVIGQHFAQPDKYFHELMSQPAPHGSYLRRSIKENFPVWWVQVSKEMKAAGLNLPEMNEYDKSIEMPKTHTRFDSGML